MIDSHDSAYQRDWRLLTDEEVENEPRIRRGAVRLKLPPAGFGGWLWYAVRQETVVLVEGVRDIGPHIRAWKRRRGLSGHLPDLHILRGVDSLEANEIATYLRSVLPRPPAVLIIDTLPVMRDRDTKQPGLHWNIPRRDVELLQEQLGDCWVVLIDRSEDDYCLDATAPARERGERHTVP